MDLPSYERILEGLDPREQIELALTAARLAFVYWRSANPEREYQAPLAEALAVVESYCATGQLNPHAKEIAELAYRTIHLCDLPVGHILRSSGFAVAHIAMAPWLNVAGRTSNAQDSARVAISYSATVHRWAGKLAELEGALIVRRQELLDQQARSDH